MNLLTLGLRIELAPTDQVLLNFKRRYFLNQRLPICVLRDGG